MSVSLDSKVLAYLMARGRASWAELAEHLGVSAPAAAERTRKLEERGVIRGYAAIVDAEAAGFGLTAFVWVTLEKSHNRQAFLKRVKDLEEISECHHVAGEYDFLIKVRCRGTRDLDTFLTERLRRGTVIARTHSTIVLGTYKESVTVPIAADG
jgi:Lrp/AsnC family transcriptional regulator, leucine-responsive regulatory protein